ncbi:MAG: hypothetical protein QOF84_3957 [Streptomyces sp.]|nr:hypothetical protein [Streptomyces sp.]
MRVSRIMAGAAMTVAAIVLPAATAFADPSVSLFSNPTTAGDDVTVRIAGCASSTAITTDIPGVGTVLVSGTAPNLTGSFTVPDGTNAGTYHVTVNCTETDGTPGETITNLQVRDDGNGGNGGNNGGNGGNHGGNGGNHDNNHGGNHGGNHGNNGDHGRGDHGRDDHGRGDHGGGFDPCDDGSWGGNDNFGGDHGRGDHGRDDGRENGRDNGRENGRDNGRDNGRENGRDNGRETYDRGDQQNNEMSAPGVRDNQDQTLDDQSSSAAGSSDGKNTVGSWDGGQDGGWNGGGGRHDNGHDNGGHGGHGGNHGDHGNQGDQWGYDDQWNDPSGDDCDNLAVDPPTGSPHTGVGGSIGGLNTTETAIGSGLLAAAAGGGIYLVRRRRMNGGRA